MTPERLAYRSAWRIRRQTGNDSAEVLTAELRAKGAQSIWLDTESDLHAWLFDCWQSDVGPTRLTLKAMKKAASFIPAALVRPVREIRRHLR